LLNVFVKLPLDATVTACAAPLSKAIVSVTGLDVASLVVPATVTEVLDVDIPSAGEVMFSVGAIVSTVKIISTAFDVLPSKSLTYAENLCSPSESTEPGVNVHR
jgi:hypothetical protein